MDYGPDYPPPEPAPAGPSGVNWQRLGQRCINTIAIYCAIAGIGLAALSIWDALTVRHLSFQDRPDPGYTMTIVSPSPHPAVPSHRQCPSPLPHGRTSPC